MYTHTHTSMCMHTQCTRAREQLHGPANRDAWKIKYPKLALAATSQEERGGLIDYACSFSLNQWVLAHSFLGGLTIFNVCTLNLPNKKQ